MCRLHYRFMEPADEHLDDPSQASRPDDLLRRVYRENALKLFKR
jgi:hypothetical protein